MTLLWHSSTESVPESLAMRHELRLFNEAAQGALNAPLIIEVAAGESPGPARAILRSRCDDGFVIGIYDPGCSVAGSVQWIKEGAAHVATTPEELELFVDGLEAPPDSPRSRRTIGVSASARRILESIEMVANRRCNVLIEGETGTGKEVVARAVHSQGTRSRGPWVAVNCGAIPEALLEAELFGYVRGAFTGAVQTRIGKFELANHGTIFLDEIGDMPLATQAKLLRVIQERDVEKLGSNEPVRLDVRIVAATNVNLAARVADGGFRQDLFYRLNVFRIELPPLRERTGDILGLASHFVAKICASEKIPLKTLDRSAVARLEAHPWPGNIRELENAIEAAVVISGKRSTIFPSDLRLLRPIAPCSEQDEKRPPDLPLDGVDYQRAREDFEKVMLSQALTRTRGNKTAAAQLLGLKRTTLSARMRALEARMPHLVA
jgi:transcriptional regulator with PAS, ATPase and Fis domain